MTRPQHKISLVEKKSPHFMERKPRYDVQVNGISKGELYYNMTGYVGSLPMVDGRSMNIGERGISAFRKEISILNREAEDLIHAAVNDQRKAHEAFRTDNSHTVALLTMVDGEDPELFLTSRNAWNTARAIFPEGPIGVGFFEEQLFSSEDEPAVLFMDPDHWLRRALPDVKNRIPDFEEHEKLNRKVDEVISTANHGTVLVIARRIEDDCDPEPYFASRLSLQLARAHFGDDMRVSDLAEAEPEIIPDPADRARIIGDFTWFDLDAGTVPRHVQQQEFGQKALETAARIRAQWDGDLDAAQRHHVEQIALTGPEDDVSDDTPSM